MNILKITGTIALIMLASCSDWVRTESVDVTVTNPWDRDPARWEQYKRDIREYKQNRHSLVYVRFENSPETSISEKGFMRCLPDSIDIVSLTNADNFSEYDAEDMEWMRSVGTKVLYQLDFASRAEEFSGKEAVGAYIEKAATTVRKHGLTGFSFTLNDLQAGDGNIASEAIRKLSEAKPENGLLVFEGNPVFIPTEDMDKIDLFVISSESVENSFSLKNLISDAVGHGVPKDRIILAASLNGEWYNEDNVSKPVLEAMADNVITFGPMAGLALFDIESDYYHYEGNWLTIRSVIERLNPSH